MHSYSNTSLTQKGPLRLGTQHLELARSLAELAPRTDSDSAALLLARPLLLRRPSISGGSM